MDENTGGAGASAEPIAAHEPAGAEPNAIEKAFEAVGLTEAPAEPSESAKPEPDAKAEDTASGPARDAQGRFTAQPPVEGAQPDEPAPKAEEPNKETAADGGAPSRFSPDAKAEWDKTPASVRGEIGRAIGELEKGIQGYQQTLEPLKPYMDIAQKSGTTLQAALKNYMGVEQALMKDPIKGLDAMARAAGTSLEAVAKQINGQTPDQALAQRDAYVARLEKQVQQLQTQVSGVDQRMNQQQMTALEADVAAFKATHPRFEELETVIAQGISSGFFPADLPKAYEMAERLNPAPQPAPAPVSAAPTPPAPEPQKPEPILSIGGAPRGSDPQSQPPSQSAREATKRALEKVGLA